MMLSKKLLNHLLNNLETTTDINPQVIRELVQGYQEMQKALEEIKEGEFGFTGRELSWKAKECLEKWAAK